MARRSRKNELYICPKAVSTASLFYIFCSCLCVSYPVLASVNGRIQGSTLPDTSLRFCELYEPYLSTSHRLIHSDGVLGMLNQLQYHLDNQIVRPKLRNKCKCQPKSFPASSLVQSFVLIVCTAESILYLSLMLFIGTLFAMYPLLVVSCVPLVLVACTCVVNQVTINNPQSVKPQRKVTSIPKLPSNKMLQKGQQSHTDCHQRSMKKSWQYKCTSLYFIDYYHTALLLMSGDIETNPGPTPPTTPASPITNHILENNIDMKMTEKAATLCLSDSSCYQTEDVNNSQYLDNSGATSEKHIGSMKVRYSTQVSYSDMQTAFSVGLEPSRVPQEMRPPYIPLTDDEIESFCRANRFYRDGKYCIINHSGKMFYKCPLCDGEYQLKRMIIKSHVIPNCVLKVYLKVHGDAHPGSIYDFSTGEAKLNPDSLNHKLLCETCEKATRDDQRKKKKVKDKEDKLTEEKHRGEKAKDVNDQKDFRKDLEDKEEKLKNLYSSIIAKPNCPGFDYRDKDDWLRFVLAQIMFRGLFVNVNLTECFQDHNFKKVFYDLWMYCKEKDFNERPTPPDFRLFLLPNRSMNEELQFLLYPLDLFLRMPHYTEYVTMDTGSFLYTKFDCFHLVLPVRTQIFDKYNSCLKCKDDQTKSLCWSLLRVEKPNILQTLRIEPKMRGIELPWQVSPDSFPYELINWNWQFFGRYIMNVYGNASVKSTHIIFVEKHRNHSTSLGDMVVSSGRDRALTVDSHTPYVDSSKFEFVDVNTETGGAMINIAASKSPIRDIISTRAMKEKLLAMAQYLKRKLDSLGENDQAVLQRSYTTAQIELRIALTDSEHILHLPPLETLMEEIIEIRERQQRERLTREREEEIRIIQDEYDDKLKEQSEVHKAEVESQMARAERFENQLKNEIEQSEIQHKTRIQGLLLGKDKEIEKLKEKIASLEQERYQENHDLKMEVVKMKYKIKERELEDRHAEEEKEMHEHLNDVKKFFDDFRQKQAEDKERKEKQLMKHLKRLLQIPKQAGPRRSISLTAETDTDFENETTTEVLRSLSSTCNC